MRLMDSTPCRPRTVQCRGVHTSRAIGAIIDDESTSGVVDFSVVCAIT